MRHARRHALLAERRLGSHKIAGWVTIDPKDVNLVRYAIYQFGGVLAGIELPISAQEQNQNGQPWDVVDPFGLAGQPGSWGGHEVYIGRYRPGMFTCRTWGEDQDITDAFLAKYCDEINVPVSQDFLNVLGIDPNGINLAELLKDLADLGPVL